MTRKDYILIAAALKASRPADLYGNDTARKTWYATVSELSLSLARDNARFDATRFFDACGVPT